MMLETVTGKLIDIDAPTYGMICLDDIAWGLSRLPRFAGHTTTRVAYNVAQHSLFVANIVAKIMEDEKAYDLPYDVFMSRMIWQQTTSDISDLMLQALIHDAAEAYIGDIPSPVKHNPRLHSIFKEIESKLMEQIYLGLQILPPSEDAQKIIKFADKVAQAIEANAFMPSRGRDWGNPKVPLLEYQEFEDPQPSLTSYQEFVMMFNNLQGKRND
jgi:uncharacterized protein